MKWTTKQLTRPGFYWYREENRAVVLEVRESFVKGKILAWDGKRDDPASMTLQRIGVSGMNCWRNRDDL